MRLLSTSCSCLSRWGIWASLFCYRDGLKDSRNVIHSQNSLRLGFLAVRWEGWAATTLMLASISTCAPFPTVFCSNGLLKPMIEKHPLFTVNFRPHPTPPKIKRLPLYLFPHKRQGKGLKPREYSKSTRPFENAQKADMVNVGGGVRVGVRIRGIVLITSGVFFACSPFRCLLDALSHCKQKS